MTTDRWPAVEPQRPLMMTNLPWSMNARTCAAVNMPCWTAAPLRARKSRSDSHEAQGRAGLPPQW